MDPVPFFWEFSLTDFEPSYRGGTIVLLHIKNVSKIISDIKDPARNFKEDIMISDGAGKIWLIIKVENAQHSLSR